MPRTNRPPLRSLSRPSVAVLALMLLGASGRAVPGARRVRTRPSPGIAMHGHPGAGAGVYHIFSLRRIPMRRRAVGCGCVCSAPSTASTPSTSRPARPPRALNNLVFEPLMARSLDEPFTLYGLIARSIETDDARSFATFRLDPAARFSDGTPITSDDVRFTFDLLKAQGRPQQRQAFALVHAVETPDPETIRFDLRGRRRPRTRDGSRPDAGAVAQGRRTPPISTRPR